MPKSEAPKDYITYCGYYSANKKLYEHTFIDNKLSCTKMFSPEGILLHEMSQSSDFNFDSIKNYGDTGSLLSCYKRDPKCTDAGVSKGEIYSECGLLSFVGDFKGETREGYGVEYNEKGTTLYEGNWKNNLLNGSGIKFYETGLKMYEGEWKNSVKEGSGTSYYQNGNKLYHGQFKDGLYYGEGTEYYRNGKIKYAGGFYKGQIHSHGIKYDQLGNKEYEGDIVYTRACGNGKCFHKNGALEYVGGWKDNCFHGNGLLYHPNGFKKYEGCFKNGYFHGSGAKYDYCGNLLQKAKWNEDKIITLLMDNCQLKGGWDVIEPISGISYIGQVESNKPHGYGVGWDKKSGEKIYEGHWQNGEPSGFGKNFHRGYSDHPFPFFIANFYKQRLHGLGVHFSNNGKVLFRGQFENDHTNENQFYIKYLENGAIDTKNLQAIIEKTNENNNGSNNVETSEGGGTEFEVTYETDNTEATVDIDQNIS